MSSSIKKNFRNIMKLEEICGQKILTSFLPPEDSNRMEIFAKNIPHDLDEEQVCRFFELVGPVHILRLMMDKNNRANRGFAYITYLKSPDAETAIRVLNEKEIVKNFPVNVTVSMNNCRIFLGGIPVRKTKDEVWQELEKNRITNIVDVIMYRSYNNRAQNRGFVFVEFPSHQYAAKMRNKMRNKMKGMTLWNCEIIVDWSVPEVPVSEEDMMKVKILYLRNLNVMESRDNLKAIVETYVNPFHVEKVYKFKNYAFIHLISREVAEELLKMLKGHYRNTPVEVTFAKPPSEYTKPSYRKQVLSKVSKSIMPNDEVTNYLSSYDVSCTSNLERVRNPLKELGNYNSSHQNTDKLFGSRQTSCCSTFENLDSYKKLTPPLLGNELSNLHGDIDLKPMKWSDIVKTNYEMNTTLEKGINVWNRPVQTNYMSDHDKMTTLDLHAPIELSYLNFESDLRCKKEATNIKEEVDQEFGLFSSSPNYRPKQFPRDFMGENENPERLGYFGSFGSLQGRMKDMTLRDEQESSMVEDAHSRTSQYFSWGTVENNQNDRTWKPFHSIENIPFNRIQNRILPQSSKGTDADRSNPCNELSFDYDCINNFFSD